MRDAIHRRRWREDQSGMSLVEIMIAVFVLSVGLLALASTAITSIVSLRVSRGRQEATDAASALIEDLRRSDFSSIALDETDPLVSDYLTDEGGCDPDFDEPIVTTSQPGGLLREQTFGPSGRVTVHTSVSWYDENDDPALVTCSDSAHTKRVKRVRVVAKWEDGDRTFDLEEWTLVAPVDRGLPAPDFRLSPSESDLVFTLEDKTNEIEKCIPHLLRNLGAEDGYDWEPRKVEGSTGAPAKIGTTEFPTSESKWIVRSFLEFPPHDPLTNPADSVGPGHESRDVGLTEVELLRDEDASGRPETAPATRLAAGDEAILWVCYRAGDNLAVDDWAKFEVDVHSLFDENRMETLTHNVRVSETFANLFLYDDDETLAGSSGPRETGSGGNARLPILRMGPERDAQPEQLGTAASMPDYDTDLDPHGLPGTRLAPTAAYTEANQIIFHEQVTEDTTFASSIDLNLFTAAEKALLGTATADATLRFQVEMALLNSNENNNQAQTILLDGASAAQLSQIHSATSGWVGWLRTLQMNGGSPLFVEEGQYLRLKITCLDTSDDVCHLGYDHVNQPSHLRLEVRS